MRGGPRGPFLSHPSPTLPSMSDDRAIVYHDPDVGAWVYRASSVGRSLRCLSSARQGYDPLPPPDYLVEAAEQGNRYEVIVKTRLRGQGYRISGEQGVLEYEVLPGVLIRGHMDASHCLIPEDSTDRLLEVKSMSARVFDKWLRYGFEMFPEYAAQVTVYMWSEGRRRGLDAPVEAVYAVVSRETDDLDVRVLTEPPVPIQTIVQKVALAEQFAAMSQLPICDSASQYSCPYDYLCDRHEILFEEVEEGTEKMLKGLGDRYIEVMKMEKTVKEKKDGLRDEIRLAMGARDTVKIPQYTFSNKPIKRRELNLAKLRARLGDELDEYFEDKETAPSLRVYTKKEE